MRLRVTGITVDAGCIVSITQCDIPLSSLSHAPSSSYFRALSGRSRIPTWANTSKSCQRMVLLFIYYFTSYDTHIVDDVFHSFLSVIKCYFIWQSGDSQTSNQLSANFCRIHNQNSKLQPQPYRLAAGVCDILLEAKYLLLNMSVYIVFIADIFYSIILS